MDTKEKKIMITKQEADDFYRRDFNLSFREVLIGDIEGLSDDSPGLMDALFQVADILAPFHPEDF